MLGFLVGAVARRRAVAALAVSLADGISEQPAAGRAAILVLANSLLRAAAALHGPALAEDPAAAGRAAAHAALRDILQRRDRLAAIVGDGRAPHLHHAALDLRAAELACLTLGVAVAPSVRKGCARAWRAAWDGRHDIRSAVAGIRRYEREAGVPAVPLIAGLPEPSDIDLARTGASVPAFLRRKA